MPVPLAAGSRLGPYEVVAPLGAGGMGEVWRARDTRLGRDVAVKVIPTTHAQDPERIARFEQEARAAGALSHPNVCAVHDVGTHEGSPFVVMELLEGQTLRDVLAKRPIPLRRALDLAAQIAGALAAAHAKGIAHRDVKPENVFVTADGRAKVLDFGLAKLLHREPAGSDLTMSSPGAISGTSAYMSPEQAAGGTVDARADVFALGIVLFEMLSGRRPFVGGNALAMMHAILHEEPIALASVLPDAPAELGRIVRRCLEKDPDRRIQTALDVRNDLDDLVRELDRGPAAVATPAREGPVDKRFVLTAAHVRELSDRNPRLVGYPMVYRDNGVSSDTLVVLLHGLGADDSRYEPALSVMPWHAVAPNLVGFERDVTNRPSLPFDDHSRILRMFVRHLIEEHRPKTTVLVGHSAGADQVLRMISDLDGPGVDVDVLLLLAPNLSTETLFVSRRYVGIRPERPESTLEILKALGAGITSLETWLILHYYLSQTFLKLGSELEPLRRYAIDLVAPFEEGGDPFPGWYRTARARVPRVRIVLTNAEAAAGEVMLARHLESNVLGDGFEEDSFVIERGHHFVVIEPPVLLRHLEAVIAGRR